MVNMNQLPADEHRQLDTPRVGGSGGQQHPFRNADGTDIHGSHDPAADQRQLPLWRRFRPSQGCHSRRRYIRAFTSGRDLARVLTGRRLPPQAVAVAFVGILFASTFVYFRRRKRRVSHTRSLDTAADLAAWGLRTNLSAEGISRVDLKSSAMLERSDGRSVLHAGRDEPLHVHGSRQSIATNSVSTGLPVIVHRVHAGTRSLPSTRRTSLTSGSDSYGSSAADEDSISPFSDLNRPAASVPATRDNIHRAPAFSRSYSSFSLTPSSFMYSLATDDERGSLHSRHSRVASSDGATWASDDRDNIGVTARSSSRIT